MITGLDLLSVEISHGVHVVPLLCQYVLAVGSSVFHAMFYGELAEDQDEIRIPDVEPPSFLAMLKYVALWFSVCGLCVGLSGYITSLLLHLIDLSP